MKESKNIDETTNKENNDNPEQNNKSYIETIYGIIDSIISGDNPSQSFTMNFPEPVINPNDYDIKNNAPKESGVEAKESQPAKQHENNKDYMK